MYSKLKDRQNLSFDYVHHYHQQQQEHGWIWLDERVLNSLQFAEGT